MKYYSFGNFLKEPITKYSDFHTEGKLTTNKQFLIGATIAFIILLLIPLFFPLVILAPLNSWFYITTIVFFYGLAWILIIGKYLYWKYKKV